MIYDFSTKPWYDYFCGLLLRNIINLFMLVVNQFYYNSLRMKFIHVFTYSKTCIAESYTYRLLSTNLSNEQRGYENLCL